MRPLRPIRAIPHPITIIQNMIFWRKICFWWRIPLSMMKMKMESCHVISLARSVLLLLGETGRCARCALEMCATQNVRETKCAPEMCARQDVRSWTFLASKLSSGSLRCCVLRYNNTLVPYHFGATLFQALLRASSKST